MADFSTYISDLLFEHECVIVPGFGALITRYYPAEVNPATRMLRPPSRRVAFNSRIHENDGLLANAFAKRNHCSYSEAMKSISQEVKAWQKSMEDGKKVYLQGIGRFYLDAHSKVQFNPSIDINYHKASFGLSIFRAPAIQREIEINRSIEKAIEKQKVAVPTRKIGSTLRWAAVVTPLIALGIAAGVYLDRSEYELLDRASIFPFFNTESTIDAEKPAVLPATIKQEPVEVMEIKNEVPVQIIAEDEVIKSVEIPSDHFHIVVGSFKDKQNASNYILNLQSKGFDAYITTGDPNFNRVAIGKFSSREDADRELLRVKSQVNSGAWIYIN